MLATSTVAGQYSSLDWSNRWPSCSWFRMQARITASSRPTVDTKYPVPARGIPPLLTVHPGHRNRALALDIADHLRHRELGRYRDHHVRVTAPQVPLLDPALLLLGRPVKYLSKMDFRKCQTSTATPAEPGDLPYWFSRG